MNVRASQEDNKQLALRANAMRALTLRAIHAAGSGHPGGSLGMADVMTALFFRVLQHDPKNPIWEQRDRLILSNGHICPILYCVMAASGYFPQETLMTLRKFGSPLQGHPHRKEIAGLETSSGPLGSGLSQACGMAAAAKLDHKTHTVYVLTSDGEHQEGNTWEAVMFAAKYHLDNLIQIIDRNYIQIDGTTEEVMPLDSLQEKYEAFGWHAQEINGHRFAEIMTAINNAKATTSKPSVIIAKTVPGKGVSFMEGSYKWHGVAPKDDELARALEDVEIVRENIENGTYDY